MFSRGQSRISGACSEIISGWIRDQRPAFAIKLILESDKQDLYSYLCTFARAAAAHLEEPETMLRSMQSLLKKTRYLPPTWDSDTDDSDTCSYRCCVCEGYAESQRMDRVGYWLSQIGRKDNYEATISRVADLLLEKGQLEQCERWAMTLPEGAGNATLWSKVALMRLQRGEVVLEMRSANLRMRPMRLMRGARRTDRSGGDPISGIHEGFQFPAENRRRRQKRAVRPPECLARISGHSSPKKESGGAQGYRDDPS